MDNDKKENCIKKIFNSIVDVFKNTDFDVNVKTNNMNTIVKKDKTTGFDVSVDNDGVKTDVNISTENKLSFSVNSSDKIKPSDDN